MKLMRTAFIVVFMLLFAVSAFAVPVSKKFSKKEIKKMADTRAIIETSFGNIELKFFPDVAPNHVNNFIELSKKGFYDGTLFHRVIPGFMIHGQPRSYSES
jgi:peptidyl-prolyl cis-trans isomerase B (cyclophilin B)